ncbi:MAG: hypothetical protein K8T90_05590 [Planctomycetes bacterium]|nr:hypothetical protein [Planctomycetota bacterium]
MAIPRWTRWAAVGVLAAFVVFDLCGRRRGLPLPGTEAIAAVAGDAQVVPFERLSDGDRPFPPGGAAYVGDAVADDVGALVGRRIAVAGYMLPTVLEGDRATQFILCRHANGCCFGAAIEADDLIDCAVADPEGAPIVSLIPVLVVGVFRVNPARTGADLASGLYGMDAVEVRRLPR